MRIEPSEEDGSVIGRADAGDFGVEGGEGIVYLELEAPYVRRLDRDRSKESKIKSELVRLTTSQWFPLIVNDKIESENEISLDDALNGMNAAEFSFVGSTGRAGSFHTRYDDEARISTELEK